jgi:hypothetical protein
MSDESTPLPIWLRGHEESILCEENAVAFVNATGFCTIDNPRTWEFPYLAAAFPGRPDGVLGRIWFWKDDLHTARRVYYTRLFGGQPGFISNEWLPVCIAAYGDAADELIHTGRISQTAREAYEALERHGPLASRELKRMLSEESRGRCDTALKELERRFIITKVGLTGRERGTYGYVLDLAERWAPEAFEAAGRTRREDAVEGFLDRLRSWGINPDARTLRRMGLADKN